MSEEVYWIWLQQVLGPCSRHLVPLLERYGNPKEVYEARADLCKEPQGLSKGELSRLKNATLDQAKRVEEHNVNLGYQLITLEHPDYPEGLREIFAPPAVLYCKGRMNGLQQKILIAMVGTRKFSVYGKKTAELFSKELAEAGVGIVSGCALGVDSSSHIGALKGGGTTYAVLGCGLDIDYPAPNRELKELIAQNGALISEYPAGTQALPYYFPMRNRIISGMSHGVLVVEGSEKSGSMITAGYAASQNRDLFAVPGDIFSPTSKGPNRLIRDGAIAATCTLDILGEYLAKYPERITINQETEVEQLELKANSIVECSPAAKQLPQPPGYLTALQKTVYVILEETPQDIETIVAKTKLPVYQVLSILTELELCDLIKPHSGKRFSLRFADTSK